MTLHPVALLLLLVTTACRSPSGPLKQSPCEPPVDDIVQSLRVIKPLGDWQNLDESTIRKTPWLSDAVSTGSSEVVVSRVIEGGACTCCETVLFRNGRLRALTFAYRFSDAERARAIADRYLRELLPDEYYQPLQTRLHSDARLHASERVPLAETEAIGGVRQLMVDVDVVPLPTGGGGLSMAVTFGTAD